MTIQEMIDSGANVQVVVNLLDLKEYGRSLIEETKKDVSQPDERLTQKEVCEILKKNVCTVIRYAHQGILSPICYVGKTPYYSKKDVDNLLNIKQNEM